MRTLAAWTIMAAFAAPLWAAESGYGVRIPLQRDEKFSVTCNFPYSVISVVSVTATPIQGTDSTPTDIVPLSSVSNVRADGKPCKQLNSCAAVVLDGSGAPASPVLYQIHVNARTADPGVPGDGKLDCDFRADVEDVVFSP